MTKITIYRKDNRIVKYEAVGHAGYAEIGKDIVCAGVSMVLQNAIMGIQILGIDFNFKMEDGYIFVDLTDVDLQSKEREITILLETMVSMLEELEKQYPEYITYKNKKENDEK